MNKPKLSIVIPVLNEEGSVEKQNKKIKEQLGGKVDYEVIWVDDGSTDETSKIIAQIAKGDKRVKGITLMRTVGQSGALMAGIDRAEGEYIGLMDGDNQNDPKEFIEMFDLLEKKKLDAVVGWRQNRWDGNIIRRIPSLMANWLIKVSLQGTDIHDTGCPVKLIRADLLKEIRLYGELHRFLSYILHMNGARLGEIPITHRERESGSSKYGIGRTLTVLFDILNVRFLLMRKKTPIQVFGPIGLLLYVLSFILFGFLALEYVFNAIDVSGSPFFITSIIGLVMGTQFITFGLLGELIIRSYYENSESKKTYMIRSEH